VTENPPLHVVAAIIIQDGRVLACRRAKHKTAAGFWEFPGGKVDLGESSHDALVREISEELNLACQAIATFDISDTPVGSQVIRLETIVCQVEPLQSIQSTDHDEFKWLAVSDLENLDWAKPDLPAVRLLSELEDFSTLVF
jgi:8-oxo-dGTP diphosphatase